MIQGKQVLWVDADYATIASYIQALKRQGYTIDHASTFAEALVLAKRNAYALAIIELVLPDALGTDVWGQLSKRYPAMHAVMTTGVPSLHKNVNARGKRVLAYLLKPFNSRVILRLVERSLG